MTGRPNVFEPEDTLASSAILGHATHDQMGVSLGKVGVCVDRGASGWDQGVVESPCVWWDVNKQRYAMVYVGYDSPTTYAKVGLAWSDDLFNWTKDATNPIFEGSGVANDPDEVGTSGPVMWYEDGTYYLFYIGLTATGYEQGTKSICLATTTDTDLTNATWTRRGAVVSPSGSGWRGTAVWHVSIVKHDDAYYMFFNASSSVDSVERIGYATSQDLLTWTVDDVNSPVLDKGAAGAWDDVKIGDPAVWRSGDYWYMAYFGDGGTNAQDGLAYCTVDQFPTTWTKHSQNPTLTVGGSGSIDDTHAHKPFIFRTPQGFYHFYTAAAPAKSIALAVAPWRYNNMMANCRETTRSTTSTTYTAISESSIIVDLSDKGYVEFRIVGRANPGSDTLSVRDVGNLNSAAEVTGLTGSWQNFQTPWVPVGAVAASALTNTYAEFKSAAGGTVQIGNVAYEFRWVERA